MNLNIVGNHYATRNEKSGLKIGDQERSGSGNALDITINSDGLKDTHMEYSFEYEYTDHYINIYSCRSRDEDGRCTRRVKTGERPDWSKARTYSLSEEILMDFEQEERVERDTIEDILSERFVVGKKDYIHGNDVTTQTYHEQWNKKTNDVLSSNELKTQTTLPIKPDELTYHVQLPSGNHANEHFSVLKEEQSHGYYYPVDVDDSLKEEYANDTDDGSNDYAYPLQQRKMERIGPGVYEMDYVSDLFFMTENTGFIIGHPYAEAIRHGSIPEFSHVVNQASYKMQQEYESATGQEHTEDMLFAKDDSQIDRLQRYAIPVSPESPLRPNQTYTNEVVLYDMGLNDLIFDYGIEFSFEHYMFGSGYDEAWLIEQSDPRVSMEGLTWDDVNQITIKYDDMPALVELIKERPSTDKMHKFRTTDGTFPDKLKEIIGDWNEQ